MMTSECGEAVSDWVGRSSSTVLLFSTTGDFSNTSTSYKTTHCLHSQQCHY